MANVFQITISATDKATAVAQKVNASIAKIAKPINEVHSSVAAFSKEVGLDKVGKGLDKVGVAAEGVARKIAAIAPPMAALAGVGTVAGIAALAYNWGKAATEISNTSSVIGVSTQDLQRYRGAARLAGLSAEDMTGSMRSLGSAFEDASAGRNTFAAGVLSDKGIGIHRLKDGTVDVVRGLRDISAVASKMGNAQAQKAFLDIFGLGSLQAMIRRGTLDKYLQQFDKLKATMSPEQIAQGERFNESMVALDASVDKLKNSVGSSLTPALGRLVENLIPIANEYGPKIAAWIDQTDWNKTAKSVAGVADSLGGVKGIAIGLAAITFARPIAGLVTLIAKAAGLSSVLLPLVANPVVAGIAGLVYSKDLNTGEDEGIAKHRPKPGQQWSGDPIGDKRRDGAAKDASTAGVVAKFKSMGWSQQQAAGIAANLFQESLFNPSAVGDGGKAFGLAQWHEDRQAAFKKLFGIDIRKSSLDQQLQFVDYELRHGQETKAGGLLSKARSADEAGSIVSRFYERPADAEGEASKRGQAAAAIDSSMSSLYAAQPKSDAPAAQQSAPEPGKVHVEIHIPNAPAGTRTNVKTTGDVSANARIGHSNLLGPNV